MHDIFISYAKKDKQHAQSIARVLENEGFDVWWDISIPAGKSFDSVIEDAIEKSKCVIVIWSSNSVRSEWVHVEAAEGKKRNILIPVRIEDVEVPLAFRRRQYVDLIDWDNTSNDPPFRRLLDDIRDTIQKEPSTEKPQVENADLHMQPGKSLRRNVKRTAPKKPFSRKNILTALIIVVVLAIMAELLGFTDVFSKNETGNSFQLTVFVTDESGNVVLEHSGELNTSIGNRPMRETIGEDGRTNFGDILPNYVGDTIKIGFKAEGWELADPNNSYVFDGNPIKLRIKKDESLGIVKGVVKTRDGQNFIDKANILINTDTIIRTDSNGIFKVILPPEMRVKAVTEGYKLTISKEGFETKSQYFYPKSSDAEIRLKKTE